MAHSIRVVGTQTLCSQCGRTNDFENHQCPFGRVLPNAKEELRWKYFTSISLLAIAIMLALVANRGLVAIEAIPLEFKNMINHCVESGWIVGLKHYIIARLKGS